jgi:hypothetical protein
MPLASMGPSWPCCQGNTLKTLQGFSSCPACCSLVAEIIRCPAGNRKKGKRNVSAKISGENRSFWRAAIKLLHSDAQSYGNWTRSAILVLLCRCTDHPLPCGKSRIQGKWVVRRRKIQQNTDFWHLTIKTAKSSSSG